MYHSDGQFLRIAHRHGILTGRNKMDSDDLGRCEGCGKLVEEQKLVECKCCNGLYCPDCMEDLYNGVRN